MRSTSRRGFITTSALASLGVGIGHARTSRAFPLNGRHSAATLLPDPVDSQYLRALATAAIDAAATAGASYADIRLGDLRRFRTYWNGLPRGQIQLDFSFGMSVMVGGACTFVFGADPTLDSITQTAGTAVATARSQTALVGRRTVLPKVPTATGEWHAPVQIDPLSVPLDDHFCLLGAYRAACTRMPGAGSELLYLAWTDETRVFASTEGALVTQRFHRAEPDIRVRAERSLSEKVILPVQGFSPRSAGFEMAIGSEPQERIKATVDEADQLARLPVARAEVGRYEAVLDGVAVAAVASMTLAPALELARVCGEEADSRGTSFLSPPNTIIGAPLFSHLLSATSTRDVPHYGGAHWDDEGIETRPLSLITQGKVTSYFATRRTAASVIGTIPDTAIRLAGSAVAWTPTTVPVGCAAQMSISPGSSSTSFDALVSQLSNGIVGRGIRSQAIYTDQQLSGGIVELSAMCEVKRGQLTRRLLGGYVQFGTKTFWKSLSALGDSGTVGCYGPRESIRGDGEGWVTTTVTSPAVTLKQLDILQTGIGR